MTYFNLFFQQTNLLIRLAVLIGICSLISCKKADLSPISGIYVGETVAEKWGFEEILDQDGNLTGIQGNRDTLMSQQDTFYVNQIGNSNQFNISGSQNIARINALSDHAFTYEDQQDFSLVQETNGVVNKRFTIMFDGAGNAAFEYFDENLTDNRPPTGNLIIFSGASIN